MFVPDTFSLGGLTSLLPGICKYCNIWFNSSNLLDLCTVNQSMKYELPSSYIGPRQLSQTWRTRSYFWHLHDRILSPLSYATLPTAVRPGLDGQIYDRTLTVDTYRVVWDLLTWPSHGHSSQCRFVVISTRTYNRTALIRSSYLRVLCRAD